MHFSACGPVLCSRVPQMAGELLIIVLKVYSLCF